MWSIRTMADSQPITTNLPSDSIPRFPLVPLLLRLSDHLESVRAGLDALRVMAVSQTLTEEVEGGLLFISNGLDDRYALAWATLEQARAAFPPTAKALAEAPADAPV
jgi:hypothetical protein